MSTGEKKLGLTGRLGKILISQGVVTMEEVSRAIRMALLNAQARREIERVVRRVEKVETAVEPGFEEHFVGAMALPHATAPYPNLSAEVALPPRPGPSEPGGDGEGRRRRRRRDELDPAGRGAQPGGRRAA